MESAIRERQEDFAAGEADRRPSWIVEEMLVEATRKGASQAVEEANGQQKAVQRLPSPVSSEGMFEFRFVQAFIELLTGRLTTTRPDVIWLPKFKESEPLALVLSSTEQFYYRVTPSHCSCRGWFYSKGSYGMGKCRHHILAFPDIARENAAMIEGLRARRRAEAQAKKKAKPKPKNWARSSSYAGKSPSELERVTFRAYVE
jgi:hypothetical protein